MTLAGPVESGYDDGTIRFVFLTFKKAEGSLIDLR